MRYPIQFRTKIMSIVVAAIIAALDLSVVLYLQELQQENTGLIFYIAIAFASFAAFAYAIQKCTASVTIDADSITVPVFIGRKRVPLAQITGLSYSLQPLRYGFTVQLDMAYSSGPKSKKVSCTAMDYSWQGIKDMASRIQAANPNARMDPNVDTEYAKQYLLFGKNTLPNTVEQLESNEATWGTANSQS